MESENNSGEKTEARPRLFSPLAPKKPAFQGYSAPRPPAAVSPGTLAALAGTAPWVSFLGVLAWIFGSLSAVATVVSLGMAFYGSRWTERTGVDLVLSVVAGAVQAALIFALASRIDAYSRSLESLAVTKTRADLESALDEQRLIWRFCGIVGILYLAILVVTLLVDLFRFSMVG